MYWFVFLVNGLLHNQRKTAAMEAIMTLKGSIVTLYMETMLLVGIILRKILRLPSHYNQVLRI